MKNFEGVLLKLNFEKVYDNVDWDFWIEVMKKGFSYKWRMWMCVRNVKYFILINGSSKGSIQASRGLKQGDPLSPFLFVLVVDVLSWMISKGVEGNIIEPFKIGKNEVALSHLQFVDDTMLFCFGKEESFHILNHMVVFFEQMSGLKINRSKCTIFCFNSNHAKL